MILSREEGSEVSTIEWRRVMSVTMVVKMSGSYK